MPARTWARHIERQVAAQSLTDRISGACVLITAPVSLIRRIASAATGGSSSRGCE